MNIGNSNANNSQRCKNNSEATCTVNKMNASTEKEKGGSGGILTQGSRVAARYHRDSATDRCS